MASKRCSLDNNIIRRDMKFLAYYLPQFHTIPENDEWWGEGFTEWTNTKKSKPLFEGHYQPREPLEDNYYDLSDTTVMEEQAKLAKEYGLHGFCYYHYWFNGKRLLEAPLEAMLKNKNIDIPFCLSWGNEPWSRAWDGRDHQLLMPQTYGTESDWSEHFDCLARFFKDERYIKIDNKPMFLIYRTTHIPNIEEMVTFWDEKCKEMGFDGIYLTETLNGFQSEAKVKSSSAVVEFEPMYTLSFSPSFFKRVIKFIRMRILPKNFMNIHSYDTVWQNIIDRKPYSSPGKKTFLGAFVDWDNCARKAYKGTVFKGTEVDKFQHYLSQQVQKASDDDYMFINAWNEWAEGTYLEPDKRNGYGFLEAIKSLAGKKE
jgi:lipopolysaccharide biosynthesis protein